VGVVPEEELALDVDLGGAGMLRWFEWCMRIQLVARATFSVRFRVISANVLMGSGAVLAAEAVEWLT